MIIKVSLSKGVKYAFVSIQLTMDFIYVRIKFNNYLHLTSLIN